MTVEQLKRIMWRLDEMKVPHEKALLSEIRLAIMHETGTDERTIQSHLAKMVELKYIRRMSRFTYELTHNE